MAQLVGLVVTDDEAFKHHIGRSLRSGAIPVSIADERLVRDGAPPDVAVIDARTDTPSAMSAIERLRAAAPNAGIFVVAAAADPELILQSMRAGANEFFLWPPPDDTFQGAIRKAAAPARRRSRSTAASKSRG